MAKLVDLDAVLGTAIQVKLKEKSYDIRTDLEVDRVLRMMQEASEVQNLPDAEKMARMEKTFDLISEVFLLSGHTEVTPDWVRKNLKWKQAFILLRAVNEAIMDIGLEEGGEGVNP